MAAIVEVIGEPQVMATLNALDPKDRTNLERRAVRAGAKPVAEALARIAEGANVPRSFSKIKTPTVSTSGGIVHSNVRPASPLFNIFEPGAGEHTIAPRSSGLYLRGRGSKRAATQETHAGVLAGPAGEGSWTSEGRKRAAAFFSRGPVQHPGMRARPIAAAAANAAAAEAYNAMAAVILGQAPGKAIGSAE